MAELDFLPDWYHRFRLRKRIVAWQGWALLIVIVTAGSLLGVQQHNVTLAQTTLSNLHGRVQQNQLEQHQLEEQVTLRRQLQQQTQLMASLGRPIETTRLLRTLETLMPKAMSLTDFSFASEASRAANPTAVARLNDTTKPTEVLKFKLIGAVPNDVDLADFLAGLTNTPFLQEAALVYSSPRTEAGHVLREFEITFSMPLPAAGKAQ